MQLQPGRADGAYPPRAQAVNDETAVKDRAHDAQQRSDNGQNSRFRKEQSPDHRHRVARRAEDADLTQALLDSQLEEEHRQHQRRDHQEEAEVGEVLAEVGRAARCLERRGARREKGYAHGIRRQRRAQVIAERLDCRGRIRTIGHTEPQRRHRPVARPPQVAAALIGNECLWGGAVVVPVALVHRTHAREIDGERWIPIGQALRTRDTGIVGHKAPVGREARDRHDVGHDELRRLRCQAGRRVPEVVVDVQTVARRCRELARRPFVDDDGICRRRRNSIGRRLRRRTGGQRGEIGCGNQ